MVFGVRLYTCDVLQIAHLFFSVPDAALVSADPQTLEESGFVDSIHWCGFASNAH